MFISSKRTRIVKKALEKTVKAFEGRKPGIYQQFFYGAIDIGPQYLVVWYLFETDAELEMARTSGLCDELQQKTIGNLIALGYPKEAFETTNTELPAGKVTIRGSEGAQEELLYALTHSKAKVAFTTKEDIDKKANGDYHLYFQ